MEGGAIYGSFSVTVCMMTHFSKERGTTMKHKEFSRRYTTLAVGLLFLLAAVPVLAQRTIDLSYELPDVEVFGGYAWGAQDMGTFGDVNGDGIDDIILVNPYADPLSRSDAGEVQVIYGTTFLPTQIDFSSTYPDVRIQGPAVDMFMGFYGVAAGDINGDNVDDILVGCHECNPDGREDAGEVYVVYGSSSLLPTIDILSNEHDITIKGAESGDYLSLVGVGDLDGDGTGDIIVGEPLGWPSSVYVIYGGSSLPSTIDLSTTSADFELRSLNYPQAGRPWTGDINGDDVDDLLVGSRYASPGGRINAGEAYVIYGGSLPSVWDLSTTAADVTLEGDDAGDELGSGTAVGDVNGDGTQDIVIGARGADPSGGGNLAGEVYVVYGSNSLPSTIDFSTGSPSCLIEGEGTDRMMGASVATGDLNMDGIKDMLLGEEGSYFQDQSYVVYGSTSLPSVIDLSATTPDLRILQEYSNPFGDALRVGAIGDPNGDGINQFGLGSPVAYDYGGTTINGRVNILSPTVLLESDLPRETPLDPAHFYYEQPTIYWAVTGIRPASGTDYDLWLFSDPQFSNILTWSVQGGSNVDFVVVDHNHTPTGTYYPYVQQYSGQGEYNIEYDDDADILYTYNNNGPFNWPQGHVVQAWDIYMNAWEEFRFSLDVTSGNMDAGIALFKSDGSAYYVDRSSAQISADNNGAGQDEEFIYMPSEADWYGVVVWSNNDDSGTFNINIDVPVALEVGIEPMNGNDFYPGDWIQYMVWVTNNSLSPVTLDAKTYASNTSAWQINLYGPFHVTIPAQSTLGPITLQNQVPGYAPPMSAYICAEAGGSHACYPVTIH